MSTLDTTSTPAATPKPGADAGPIPDSLKRTEPVNYGELSAAKLAKLINDDYGVMLAAERSKLQRARAIGEKLVALRAGASHGEWQKKLEKWCPLISYRTANRYINIYVKWPEMEKKAAAKNAKLADLTMDEALKLLTNPPKTKKADTAQAVAQTNDKADDNSSDADTGDDNSDGEDDDGSEDAADEEDDDGFMPEVRLKAYSPADLVTLLRRIHDTEYLTALAAELMKVLRSTPSASATSASEVSVRRM